MLPQKLQHPCALATKSDKLSDRLKAMLTPRRSRLSELTAVLSQMRWEAQ